MENKTPLQELSDKLHNSTKDALERHAKYGLPIICGYEDEVVKVFKNSDGTLRVESFEKKNNEKE